MFKNARRKKPKFCARSRENTGGRRVKKKGNKA
jgi:hypothetical protein